MPLPLAGIRVVALEQAVAGPFCSRQLADLGADVVKVERPDGGDTARGYDSVMHGTSAYFAWLNRGKKSVVLDLKDDAARDTCGRLIDGADVIVHNLAPGAMERLGFGYDAVASRNPRAIWCGISGFGPDGPMRERKAYDMLVQAEGGWSFAVTGSADAPAKVGLSIADIASGMYAYASILAALRLRDQSGVGTRIDISMLECLAEWMMPALYVWLGSERVVARAGVRHNMIVPYGAYACADGDVMLAIQTDREWRRFCEIALGDAALAGDERFRTNALRVANREALEARIEAYFGERSRSDVLERLARAGVPTASVNSVPEVAAHPQLAARERWTDVATSHGSIPALRPPHNIGGVAAVMGAVPDLGQHTDEVIATLDRGTSQPGAMERR